MKFKNWLETTALDDPKLGIGQGNGFDDIDDDDDGDDDDEWNWDYIHQNYGQAIQDWIDSSECSKKLKLKICQEAFDGKPEVRTDIFGASEEGEPYDHYEEHGPLRKEGWIHTDINWEYPADNLDDFIYGTLRNNRNCDVWKAFRIEPSNTWNLLDKGRVFDYIWHTLMMSLSGVNVMNLRQKQSATQWALKQSSWAGGKIIFHKYIGYRIHEFLNKSEFIKNLKNKLKWEYIESHYPEIDSGQISKEEVDVKNIELKIVEKGQPSGQVYEDNIIGGALLVWEYKITTKNS